MWTKDHIIPDNLFPDDQRTNLWTSPACRPCNDRLAPDEEVFRIFVTGQAEEGSAGLKVWREGVRRTLGKQPKLKAMLASQMHLVEVRTPAGLYLGKQWAMYAKTDRITPVLDKIIRGLFYREKKQPLGEVSVHAFLNPQQRLPEILQGAKRGSLNSPVFEFAWVEAVDEPRQRIWWLLFYRKVLFIATCWPPEREKEFPELAM